MSIWSVIWGSPHCLAIIILHSLCFDLNFKIIAEIPYNKVTTKNKYFHVYSICNIWGPPHCLARDMSSAVGVAVNPYLLMTSSCGLNLKCAAQFDEILASKCFVKIIETMDHLQTWYSSPPLKDFNIFSSVVMLPRIHLFLINLWLPT